MKFGLSDRSIMDRAAAFLLPEAGVNVVVSRTRTEPFLRTALTEAVRRQRKG